MTGKSVYKKAREKSRDCRNHTPQPKQEVTLDVAFLKTKIARNGNHLVNFFIQGTELRDVLYKRLKIKDFKYIQDQKTMEIP